MQQEARNTEAHHRSWADSNLRNKTVQFVSAGSLEPTLEQEEAHPTQLPAEREGPTDNKSDNHANDPENLFFFDSKGEAAADTGHPDPVVPLNLTDTDDSSEDEVVFTGRRKNTTPILIESHQSEIRELTERANAVPSQAGHTLALDHTPRDPSPVTTPTGHTDPSTERPCWPPEKEIDPLVDYIANIDNDYDEEMMPSANIDLECGIDVEKVTMQLDLSSSSPTGSEINTPRSLTQILIDTENDGSSTSSDVDENDMALSGSDGDVLGDFDTLEDLAKGYARLGKQGARSGRHIFPSASALADTLESDPYFGFDIMDFDRPSLRKKPKGKRSMPELILSDSESEYELGEIWQNDRTKKKLRKKEREELRAQGLLGRKAGNPDLKVKYPKEMNMEEFMTELRSFLLSTKNRFVFYAPLVST